MKVRLIKICLNETYSKVRIGKDLSDNCPFRNGLKQGYSLLPLLSILLWNVPLRRCWKSRGGG
jgi:hypothetical protein